MAHPPQKGHLAESAIGAIGYLGSLVSKRDKAQTSNILGDGAGGAAEMGFQRIACQHFVAGPRYCKLGDRQKPARTQDQDMMSGTLRGGRFQGSLDSRDNSCRVQNEQGDLIPVVENLHAKV